MDRLISKLLGTGPYPFPLDRIEEYTRYYESDSLNIVIAKTNISFVKGAQVHTHDSYEFLIPFKPMPYIGCEGKSHLVPKDMVFPFNPFQEHGPYRDMLNCFFAAIHIDSPFMRGVVRNLSGETDVRFENKPVPLSGELKTLIAKFAEEATKLKAGNRIIMECISTQIALQLFRDIRLYGEGYERENIENSKLRFDDIVNSFEDGLYSRRYSTQSAAKEANLSKYHFIRAFRNEKGQTPYNYLLEMKISKAKKLLKESDHTIIEICFLCGFINHSHFTSTFKRKVGMSPSMFRKANSVG